MNKRNSAVIAMATATEITCRHDVKKIAHSATEHRFDFFFHGATASSGPGPPHYRGFTITLRHTTLGRTPLDAETSTWQHTTLTRDRHPCPDGIRTHNPSKGEAADPRLRPRGHWDRHIFLIAAYKNVDCYHTTVLGLIFARFCILQLC
jgi:hypothetical protein